MVGAFPYATAARRAHLQDRIVYGSLAINLAVVWPYRLRQLIAAAIMSIIVLFRLIAQWRVVAALIGTILIVAGAILLVPVISLWTPT